MKFTFEERYNFYTNNLFDKKEILEFDILPEYLIKRQNLPLYVSIQNINDEIHNNQISPYLLVTDDGYDNYNLPCFQKTRLINKHSNLSIINRLHESRHWGPFYNEKDNIIWDNKINKIIWRGAPTGNGDRIKFCDLYYEKYNVGLSCIFDHCEQYKYVVKPEITYKDFIKYKYIVSIEGNEKDSGSNWKLASNSVIIMKKPKFESWLMESKLEQWVHYVPLNDDFSNLDEIYQWCLNNDDKCKEIVKNANLFMDNFIDLKFERKLIDKIEYDYFKYIKLNVK